jgi:hypothetical protein
VVAGFSTPESAFHDPVADAYLVSNVNGSPVDKDDNGFISRVSPDGQIADLHWIDGADPDVTLHAPKGLVVDRGTLYVADIDCVRMFDGESGAPTGEVCPPGVTFLNDVAAAGDGSVVFTDSGLDGAFAPTGTDAVYRLNADQGVATVVRDAALGAPNGLDTDASGILVVTFSSGEAYRIAGDGQRTNVTPASGLQLDGVEILADGSFLMSSWADQCVYRVAADGSMTRVVENVEAPADIGFDAARNRVLIPKFNSGELVIHPLG